MKYCYVNYLTVAACKSLLALYPVHISSKCLQEDRRLYLDLESALCRNAKEFVQFFVEKLEELENEDLKKFISEDLSALYRQVCKYNRQEPAVYTVSQKNLQTIFALLL